MLPPQKETYFSPVPCILKSRRYHGSVKLDPTRVGRDASQVADEVIAHLDRVW